MSLGGVRWYVKKAARAATMLGTVGTGAVAARRALAGSPTIRAITYHQFGDGERDPWCVGPRAFDAQMRWLAERGLAISLSRALDFVASRVDVPDGSVLVTIDDGFRSVHTVARPILERYSIPAVAYVTTETIAERRAPGESHDFMTWDEVARLPESGIEVGSHAHTHRSIGRMGLQEAREEGERSRQLLRERAGVSAESFAYPYGMAGDHSDGTAQVLGGCGYSSVFISEHGVIRRGASPLRLPRVKVEGGESDLLFRLLCRGGMDAWQLVDRAAGRFR